MSLFPLRYLLFIQKCQSFFHTRFINAVQESWAASSVSSCGPKCPFYLVHVPQLVCFQAIAAPVSTTMLKKSKDDTNPVPLQAGEVVLKKTLERWGKRRTWLGFWSSKILHNPSLKLLGQHQSMEGLLYRQVWSSTNPKKTDGIVPKSCCWRVGFISSSFPSSQQWFHFKSVQSLGVPTEGCAGGCRNGEPSPRAEGDIVDGKVLCQL